MVATLTLVPVMLKREDLFLLFFALELAIFKVVRSVSVGTRTALCSVWSVHFLSTAFAQSVHFSFLGYSLVRFLVFL